MMDAARKQLDPIARAEDEDEARFYQAKWQCPRAGFKERETDSHLGEDERETLRAVQALTEVGGLTTCPLYCTTVPHVQSAARLRRQRDAHMLAMVRPHLDQIELECIEAIDAGYNARVSHEFRDADKRRAEMEAQIAANQRQRERGG